MNTSYRINHKYSGFTLIEVLIAAVVMSIGLLGLAGMQITSLKNTHSASMISQASLFAYSLADQVRANSDDINNAKLNIIKQKWKNNVSHTFPGGAGDMIENSSSCFIDNDNDNNGNLIQIKWADKAKENPDTLNKIYEFCFYHEDEA